MITINSVANTDVPPVRISSNDVPRVADQASGPEPTPSPQQIQVAVDTINRVMKQANQSMEISVDYNTKKPVVRLMDTVTGEVIRQMPSKEILAIARSIDQFLKLQGGLLLNLKA